MKTTLAFALALLLSGCATPQEWATQVMAAYGPYCDQLGYQRDTDAWRQCVQYEDAKRAWSTSSFGAAYSGFYRRGRFY